MTKIPAEAGSVMTGEQTRKTNSELHIIKKNKNESKTTNQQSVHTIHIQPYYCCWAMSKAKEINRRQQQQQK